MSMTPGRAAHDTWCADDDWDDLDDESRGLWEDAAQAAITVAENSKPLLRPVVTTYDNVSTGRTRRVPTRKD